MGQKLVIVARPGAVLRERRRRRPVLALAAALAIVLLAVGIGLASRFWERQAPVLTQPDVVPRQNLGVFEPIRGWIVYGDGSDLKAINPANPSLERTLEFPEQVGGQDLPAERYLMAAGWSAEGSMLAVDDEYNGDYYVMDRTGAVTRVRTGGGLLLVRNEYLVVPRWLVSCFRW